MNPKNSNLAKNCLALIGRNEARGIRIFSQRQKLDPYYLVALASLALLFFSIVLAILKINRKIG